MIVIDASPAVHHKAGLGRYAEELIAALALPPGAKKPSDDIVAFYHDAANATPSKLIQSLTCIATPQAVYPWRLRALLAQFLNLSQDSLLAQPINPSTHQPNNISIFHATEHLLPRFKHSQDRVHPARFDFQVLPAVSPAAQSHFFEFGHAAVSQAGRFNHLCERAHQTRCHQNIRRVREKIRVIHEGIHPRFKRVIDVKALQASQRAISLAGEIYSGRRHGRAAQESGHAVQRVQGIARARRCAGAGSHRRRQAGLVARGDLSRCT